MSCFPTNVFNKQFGERTGEILDLLVLLLKADIVHGSRKTNLKSQSMKAMFFKEDERMSYFLISILNVFFISRCGTFSPGFLVNTAFLSTDIYHYVLFRVAVSFLFLLLQLCYAQKDNPVQNVDFVFNLIQLRANFPCNFTTAILDG